MRNFVPMLTSTDHKLFVISQLTGVGARTVHGLLSNVAIDEIDLSEIGSLDKRVEKAISQIGALEEAKRASDHIISQAQSQEIQIIGPSSSLFPSQLKGLKDAPVFLYCRGDMSVVDDMPAVAIIGTRKPTEHGLKITEKITRYFAEQGWLIVSGLALGCDTVAHRTAVEANGRTLAVLAHGLHTIVPLMNTELAWKIVEEGGVLLSEYPVGIEPTRYQYVERDRIQAGLCRGVILTQSSRKGGSLHAASKSIEYGRVLAVPCPTTHDRETNCESVMANIILTGEDNTAKAELLKLSELDEMVDDNLFVLESKDGYPDLEKILSEGNSI